MKALAPWAVKRRRELKQEGLTTRVADKVAAAEHRMRTRIARLVGPDVADRARLIVSSEGQQVRFYTACSDEGLSDQQRRLLRAALNAEYCKVTAA